MFTCLIRCVQCMSSVCMVYVLCVHSVLWCEGGNVCDRLGIGIALALVFTLTDLTTNAFLTYKHTIQYYSTPSTLISTQARTTPAAATTRKPSPARAAFSAWVRA